MVIVVIITVTIVVVAKAQFEDATTPASDPYPVVLLAPGVSFDTIGLAQISEEPDSAVGIGFTESLLSVFRFAGNLASKSCPRNYD